MALDLLDNPLRVSWDLQGADFQMPEDCARLVLQRLIDARVFFVTLETTPLLHPLCREVVSRLADTGVQPLLVSDGTDEELAHLAGMEALPLALLLRLEPFLSGDRPDYDRLRRVVSTLRRHEIDPGFSLTPLKSNIGHLLPLLALGKELKIPCFKLPNLRIDANFFAAASDQVLRPGDLEKLSRELAGAPLPTDGINLEIHDLFLWEILTPQHAAGRSEYGGCQAGNSLAHVRSDGSVLPCVTWPEPLGSLIDQSFADIWMSGSRQAIRRRVAAPPAGCTDCRDYHCCFGGCRGLSSVLDIKGGIDPMCKGSRSSC